MRPWILLLLVAALPARADIEPGSWEISASGEVQGVKEPVNVVQTRCLSAEDARNPGRIFGSGPGCEFTNRRDSGGVFTFDVSCSSQPPVQGSGSVRYGRDSMDGELELKSEHFSARSRIAARRIGGC